MKQSQYPVGRPIIQCPAKLQTIGVRVSPTPRSTPVATPCSPSNNWKNAATSSSVTPARITAGSVVNSPRIACGARTKNSAAAMPMNPPPRTSAAHPASRTPGGSRRPTA